MAIGTLRCVVINVTDMDRAYRFWSMVTGLEVIGGEQPWHGRFGYLGTREPWKHEMILQLVTEPKGPEPNRVHVDVTPREGIDRAINEIVALGGSVKKPPSVYPRPGKYGNDEPVIDWAVMRDPFGNEFCLVDDLTPDQRTAVMLAAAAGAKSDDELRRAAGLTRD